jgi:hypothetical protein
MKTASDCIAFADDRRIAAGPLDEVARAVKAMSDARPHARLLVFNRQTSAPIEIDCRGSVAEVLARVARTAITANAPAMEASASDATPVEEAARSGPGRPRLGVVAREVTLLPRHWDWLASQPGGASVALRKLVDQARRSSQSADRKRAAQESAFRFMSAMAGDNAGYEEATRALFAGDGDRFAALIADWPGDVAAHLRELASAAFTADQDASTEEKSNA